MKSTTITVSILAAPDSVYAFTSDPRNLPLWATSTVSEIQQQNNDWVVPSPDGPVTFIFSESNAYGILDHTVQLPSGLEIYIAMRVFANGTGSEITFTLFQTDDMSDQQFKDDEKLVVADLNTLKQIIESLQ